jgi:hypothetical protein
MEAVKPRFEFRTFAQDFGIVLTQMRKLSKCSGVRESGEIYIMSAGNNENNTKIRDDLMDIKVFIKEEKGLQQWNPRMKGAFPMKATMIRDEVFPAFGVEVPEFAREEYTQTQYIDEIITPHKDLSAARILKHRFAFTVNDCIVEHARILINGAALQTVAVESTDVEAILEAKKMLRLEEYENVNYLIAIKRVLGWEPLPE